MHPKLLAIKRFLRYYSTVLIIVVPLLLYLPLPMLVSGPEARCGYMVLIMATYWCTEVVPLGITALLPIVFCPLLDLVAYNDITTGYMENTTMILVGGMLIAIAVENTNLHRRIAINAIIKIGASPRWLVLGFMLPTWLLSMWVSNTATVAMMIPIVEQVLKSLEALEEETDGKITEDEVIMTENMREGITNPTFGSSPSVIFTVGSSEDLTKDPQPADENTPNNLLKPPSLYLSEMKDQVPNLDVRRVSLDPSIGSASSVIFNVESSEDLMREGHEPTGWKSQKIMLKKSTSYTSDMMEDTPTLDMEAINRKIQKNNKNTKTAFLGRALTISVAYAANAGGTGTLIGTTVNPIFKGMVDERWINNGCGESPVNFASWMIMGVPIAIINLFIIWIWLEVYFIGFRDFCGRSSEKQKQEEAIIRQILLKEHAKLGPLRLPEIQCSIYFCIFVVLLFFREPGFMPGWSSLFGDGMTSDATAAILLAFLLFVIPFDYKIGGDKKAEPLVTWKSMRDKFAWDVVLLLGGGFALAQATESSGLSPVIGKQLSALEVLPKPVLVIVVGLMLTAITQFTSNQASASLFLPIVGDMCEEMGMSPLFLMFPVVISVQFAFMLPIATTPNAIAFSTGRLTVLDMVKAGVFLNIICVLVMTMAIFTWGDAYFDFYTVPWGACNTTTSALQDVKLML